MATKLWVYGLLGGLSVPLVATVMWLNSGTVARAQSASVSVTEEVAAVKQEVKELRATVIQNQQTATAAATEVRTYMLALSLQMATGYQPPILRTSVSPDGGTNP